MEVKRIDEELINELYKKILIMEIDNSLRKSKNDVQMVQNIKKLIEEKVQCFYRV